MELQVLQQSIPVVEFGFVLEPFTLDSGLTVISIYDVKENKRLFMMKKEEE